MDIQKVIEKVQRLLALASSDNPNESASALNKARVLMNKYELTDEQLVVADVREKESVQISSTKKQPRYLAYLVDMVADMFECEHFFNSYEHSYTVWTGRRYSRRKSYRCHAVFVGQNSNEEIAAYTLDALLMKLNKARKAYTPWNHNRKHLAAKRDNFCFGWVDAVHEKIKHLIPEKREVEMSTETGLIRVNPVKHYLGQKNLDSLKVKQTQSVGGYGAGYEEGTKVEVHKATHGATSQSMLNQ